MKLYKCQVCDFNTGDVCTKRSEVTEPQEQCNEFLFKGTTEWIFYEDCPECEDGPGMLYQDQFGAVCAISECKFVQNYR